MPDQTQEESALSRLSPARLRTTKIVGIALVFLLFAFTIHVAPNLFPRPGHPLGTALIDWGVILVIAGFAMPLVMIPHIYSSKIDDTLSDDEVIAGERRKLRRAIMLAPLLAFLSPLLILLATHYFPGNAVFAYTPVAVVALMLAVTIWLAPSRRAYTQRIVRKRMEEYQRHSLIQLAWAALMAGLTCYVMLPRTSVPGAAQTALGVLSALGVFFLIAISTVIAFGYGWMRPRLNPARDDEWARQLRSRSVRLGYLTLMIGVGATYVISLYAPEFLSLAIRSTLFAGIALPASFYLVLDWRAGG